MVTESRQGCTACSKNWTIGEGNIENVLFLCCLCNHLVNVAGFGKFENLVVDAPEILVSFHCVGSPVNVR